MNTVELVKNLSDVHGLSGFEDEVLTVIRTQGNHLGTWSEDSMRNLYVERFGNQEGNPVVMLDAHTDEVGFMVKAVRPDGMIEFIPVGGWAALAVPAHRVKIRTNSGTYITGVTATKPVHFMSEAERNSGMDISAMVIDVGASSSKEVFEDFHIEIGNPVTPDVLCEYHEEKELFIGKAFDCRVGCASLLSVLDSLAGKQLQVNLAAAFASQEEVGVRGATITARKLNPSAAIVFEGAPADDTGTAPWQQQAAIGKGPMLRHIDGKMIANPRFQRFALEVARSKGIPVQEAVRTGGGTNAGAIHLAGEGIPTVVLSIPVRYIHTHYGIAHAADIQHTVALAKALIECLTPEIIASF